MALSQEDRQAIAEMIAAASGGNTPQDKSEPAKAQDTSAKVSTLKRNLDPVTVEATDTVAFRVVAHSGSGALFTKGARVVPTVDGKTYRSFDGAMIEALKGDGILDAIAEGIATVDKRAKLGAHAPAKVESVA